VDGSISPSSLGCSPAWNPFQAIAAVPQRLKIVVEIYDQNIILLGKNLRDLQMLDSTGQCKFFFRARLEGSAMPGKTIIYLTGIGEMDMIFQPEKRQRRSKGYAR